jgi:hypothetical protein
VPILQSFGSDALRGFGFAISAGIQPASYELISTTVLASTATSVTFSLTAPQQAAYKHLQLRVASRSTDSQQYSDVLMRFNSDSASNYDWHYLSGGGSSVTSGYSGSVTGIFGARSAGNTAVASNFGVGVVDILDAQSTSKYKTTRALSGEVDSGYTQVLMTSGLWLNTAAISSISLVISQGGSFVTGSRFSLYGVRG